MGFEHFYLKLYFSVTGNVLAVSGGDNNVSLWQQLPDGMWKCISDSDAESVIQQS